MRLMWTGRPITKKNHGQIVMRGKYPKLLPSKQFIQYQKDVAWQVKNNQKVMIDYAVNVKCVYYMPTKHRVDLLNLMSATLDILVHYEVLKDDNSSIAVAHDGSRVYYDKDNPRVEITIERAEE